MVGYRGNLFGYQNVLLGATTVIFLRQNLITSAEKASLVVVTVTVMFLQRHLGHENCGRSEIIGQLGG